MRQRNKTLSRQEIIEIENLCFTCDLPECQPRSANCPRKKKLNEMEAEGTITKDEKQIFYKY